MLVAVHDPVVFASDSDLIHRLRDIETGRWDVCDGMTYILRCMFEWLVL